MKEVTEVISNAFCLRTVIYFLRTWYRLYLKNINISIYVKGNFQAVQHPDSGMLLVTLGKSKQKIKTEKKISFEKEKGSSQLKAEDKATAEKLALTVKGKPSVIYQEKKKLT